MGPSGSGKSTLLGVLMGTANYADFQGQVWINGRVMRVSRLRRITGYVPQVIHHSAAGTGPEGHTCDLT